MKIRRITAADRDSYLSMVQAFYASPAVLHPIPMQNAERAFEEMARSDAYADGFLLEADHGDCMGYALTAKTFTQEAGGQVVWVEEIYVLPAFRGRGAGAETLAFLESYYPDCKRFRLEIEPDNEGARRLYERLGYQTFGYGQMVKEKR